MKRVLLSQIRAGRPASREGVAAYRAMIRAGKRRARSTWNRKAPSAIACWTASTDAGRCGSKKSRTPLSRFG
jgi:hypothetical protein